MSLVGFAAAVLLLTIISTATDAKYVEGVVDTAKDMEFLERFVFEPDELGQLWYEFKYPAELCCYQMVIFNDEPQQWPYVRENEDKLTCLEKKAQIPGHYNTQVTLSTPYNCVNKTEDGKQMLVCSGTRHFTAKRARWWFINVANCNNMSPVEGIHMQYKLNMTNGVRPMDMHFSADERYTLQTTIAFAVLYLLMTLVACYYRYKLTRKRLLHSTYQLFFFSILLQLASLTFSVIALDSFARNGTEMRDLKTAGHVLSSVSDVVFILTLMLVAKGYTITRGRISTGGSVKLAIFITLYALTFTFLYTYFKANYDPRDVMFIYDSPAATGIVVMRCVGIFWLYYCILFTVKHCHEKFKFYLLFMVFYLTWFAAEPVMIGVANAFIPNYKRVKIVTGIYWAVSFMGQLYFLILTRPDRTNEYFPYHIKTNQVTALLIDEPRDEEEEPNFVNPFIGAPLTRSLSNIFAVNSPQVNVTSDAPYNTTPVRPAAEAKPNNKAKPKAETKPVSQARPGRPIVNNFVTASLHAVSCEDVNENTPARTFPKPASMNGTNFAIFCVEKPKAHSAANVHVRFENEKQPAIDTKSPPKGKKHGMKIPAMSKNIKPQQAVAKKFSASVASATGIRASPVTNDRKISEPGTEMKQRASGFVEILLDDLTTTDLI